MLPVIPLTCTGSIDAYAIADPFDVGCMTMPLNLPVKIESFTSRTPGAANDKPLPLGKALMTQISTCKALRT